MHYDVDFKKDGIFICHHFSGSNKVTSRSKGMQSEGNKSKTFSQMSLMLRKRIRGIFRMKNDDPKPVHYVCKLQAVSVIYIYTWMEAIVLSIEWMERTLNDIQHTLAFSTKLRSDCNHSQVIHIQWHPNSRTHTNKTSTHVLNIVPAFHLLCRNSEDSTYGTCRCHRHISWC